MHINDNQTLIILPWQKDVLPELFLSCSNKYYIQITDLVQVCE